MKLMTALRVLRKLIQMLRSRGPRGVRPRDDEDAEIGKHRLISREVDPRGTASVVLQDIETERTDYVGHMITEFSLTPAVLRRGVT